MKKKSCRLAGWNRSLFFLSLFLSILSLCNSLCNRIFAYTQNDNTKIDMMVLMVTRWQIERSEIARIAVMNDVSYIWVGIHRQRNDCHTFYMLHFEQHRQFSYSCRILCGMDVTADKFYMCTCLCVFLNKWGEMRNDEMVRPPLLLLLCCPFESLFRNNTEKPGKYGEGTLRLADS